MQTAQTGSSGCTRLHGKIAIVAGASTGIGRATALRLASEGAKIIVGSPAFEQELIDSLAAEIRAAGGEAHALAFDATDDSSIGALVQLAIDRFGGVDAVHANFADLNVVMHDSDAASVSDEVLERSLDVDLKGMLRITRHAIPHLLARGGGAMIYTSSVAAVMGENTRPCYAMAKAGINALVRHGASRWGREGVRVNSIMPGLVITPEKAHYMPAEIKEQALKIGRSPRLGEPEDVAALVAMLASKDGEWINGQSIAVCGGASFG